MEVILLERIHRLGATGDTVKVKDGFARNFLIPQKKALRANDANKKVFEAKRAEIEAKNADVKATAEKAAKKMENASVTLVRQSSEEGKLYGSVTVRDIADQMEVAGYEIERSQIVVGQTIKNTGTYTVRVQLHPEVIVNVEVKVVKTDANLAA